MPRPRSAPDLYLLSKVSTLYYLRDQTQQEIAERLRLSRPAVSRLLRDAQTQGIVQITISPPRGLLHRPRVAAGGAVRARASCAWWPPSRARAPTSCAVRSAPRRPRSSPAPCIRATRSAWRGGRRSARWCSRWRRCATEGVHVVQTLGGIGPPAAEAYAAELVRRLAQLLGAVPVLFPVPGVVATTEVRDVLRNDPHVQAALRYFDRLDTVYVGIGVDRHEPRAQRRPFAAGRARSSRSRRRARWATSRCASSTPRARPSGRRSTSASSASRPSSSARRPASSPWRGARQGRRDPRRAQGGHRERADHGSGHGGGAGEAVRRASVRAVVGDSVGRSVTQAHLGSRRHRNRSPSTDNPRTASRLEPSATPR